MVHGLMRSRLSMVQIGTKLKKDDWKVLNWGYPSKSEKIEDHALALVKELKKIAKKQPGKAINFVTFSMGGLVVRAAINHPECPKEAKIGRAVLIAPPNKGAMFARYLSQFDIARWYLGKASGRQLMETAHNGFDRLGQFPVEMPVLVISGTMGWNPAIDGVNDGKVSLSETCLNSHHYHELCHAGHSWICNSPKAIKLTRLFLKEEKISSQECMMH